MTESFLHLEAKEQSKIYRALATPLARSPVVLEKDVWVCWVLQTLFTMPARLPMAFKGGTSLSKVFGAIAELSESLHSLSNYPQFYRMYPIVSAVRRELTWTHYKGDFCNSDWQIKLTSCIKSQNRY